MENKIAIGCLASMFFCLMYSCNTSDNTHNSTGVLTNNSEHTSLNKDEIEINGSFPFGYIGMNKLKYPYYWEDKDPYKEDTTLKENEPTAISTVLSKIQNSPSIQRPQVHGIEYLNLNMKYKADDFYFDTVAIKILDSCIYRLPDMRNYQCYYFKQKTKKLTYGEYGSLLLKDKITGDGKYFTIYFEYGGDQHVNLRYYLIDKDTIHLYDGSCYDDGTRLNESFKISIDKQGKIEISEIKND